MFLKIRTKHSCCLFVLNICAVSFVALFFLSCSAAVKKEGRSLNTQHLAENSMMKKRLPLVERENDILKKENQQHRSKIQDLETHNKQLSRELTSLGEKYVTDMTLGEEQIIYLQETIEEIARDNSANIDSLISKNKILEEKRARENQAFTEQIVVQKAKFEKDQKLIMQEYARKELSLSTELGVSNTKLEAKEGEISSLKLANSEITGKLDAANTLSDELTKARDKALAELLSVKIVAQKAQNSSLAEIESLKATISDLNKKIAELSSLLSQKNTLNPTPSPVTVPNSPNP